MKDSRKSFFKHGGNFFIFETCTKSPGSIWRGGGGVVGGLGARGVMCVDGWGRFVGCYVRMVVFVMGYFFGWLLHVLFFN